MKNKSWLDGKLNKNQTRPKGKHPIKLQRSEIAGESGFGERGESDTSEGTSELPLHARRKMKRREAWQVFASMLREEATPCTGQLLRLAVFVLAFRGGGVTGRGVAAESLGAVRKWGEYVTGNS